MGSFFGELKFKDSDFLEFSNRLKKETKLLSELLNDPGCWSQEAKIGLELEAWLVDQDVKPAAKNQQFLEGLSDDLIVPELSQYNFEINTEPLNYAGSCLSKLSKSLESTWAKCTKRAQELGLEALMIGSLPSLESHQLNLSVMTPEARYRALNEQVMRLRDGKPIHLSIEGRDVVDAFQEDVILEAASTSIQVHLQVPLNEYLLHYNASILASSFCVAVAANSPFSFGKSLWDETRIPVFEQSLALPGFKDSSGYQVRRVSFGSGFLRRSPIELFFENLSSYPVMLPILKDHDSIEMSHLALHNGTIWRWNRPIISYDSSRQLSSLRIEHRVMSAGPSICDTVANVAFYLALTEYFVNFLKEQEVYDFDRARRNFYHAARYGLEADYELSKNKSVKIDKYLLETVLPKATSLLKHKGFAADDIDFYLVEIIGQRIESKRNGAFFQKYWIHEQEMNISQMMRSYQQGHRSGEPVHLWQI